MIRLILVLLLPFVGGCEPVRFAFQQFEALRPPAYAPPRMYRFPNDDIVYSHSIDPYIPYWRYEITKRFPNAGLVVGHGGMIAGIWCIFPDDALGNQIGIPIPMSMVAQFAKLKFPGRPIVLLSCNPSHVDLPVAGVWYAKESIWLMPDARGERIEPGNVGNIAAFVEGHPTPAVVSTTRPAANSKTPGPQ